MGNMVGKAMEDSMTRNQDFMKEINRLHFYLKYHDIFSCCIVMP